MLLINSGNAVDI